MPDTTIFNYWLNVIVDFFVRVKKIFIGKRKRAVEIEVDDTAPLHQRRRINDENTGRFVESFPESYNNEGTESISQLDDDDTAPLNQRQRTTTAINDGDIVESDDKSDDESDNESDDGS